MPRRRRRAKVEQSTGDVRVFAAVLLGAGLLTVLLGALWPTQSSRSLPSSTSNSGTTTYFGTTPASALAAATYAALPGNSTPAPPASAVTALTADPSTSQPRTTPEARRAFGKGRYLIDGHKVPLRNAPEIGSALVDRLDPGGVVTVLDQRDEWSKVRVERTRREGWVPTKRIGGEAPDEPKKSEPRIAPALSVAAIAKLLIVASIADYPGSCACPYQSARNGSSCGRRAAYSRPGGYAPLCYERDVTTAMVEEWRRTH